MPKKRSFPLADYFLQQMKPLVDEGLITQPKHYPLVKYKNVYRFVAKQDREVHYVCLLTKLPSSPYNLIETVEGHERMGEKFNVVTSKKEIDWLRTATRKDIFNKQRIKIPVND